MSRNWKRAWDLTVSGAAGTVDFTDLRIVFNIKQWTTQAPNLGQFRVYNLKKATMNAIMQQGEFTKVDLNAGYEDNNGLIFSGEVKQYRMGRENPTDTFLDIFASSGDAGYNFATTQKTFPAGSTPQQHIDEFVNSMSAHGITKGFIDQLPTWSYPRAVTFFGMTRDYLRNLAHSMGMNWWIDDQYKLNMVKKDGSVPGNITKINSLTGMIGMPVQTQGGIIVRVLINPNLHVRDQIQLNNGDIQQGQLEIFGGLGTAGTTGSNSNNAAGGSFLSGLPVLDADGTYTILMIEKNGDTRGTPWYYDLSCLASTTPGFTPPSLVPYLGPSD